MKTIAILFASLLIGCSAGQKQVAAPAQSSPQPSYVLTGATNNGIYSEPTDIVITSRMKKVVTISTATGAVTYGKGVSPNQAAREFYALVAKMLRINNCKAKAGAHSEPSGRPDSEKPEKKLP